MPELTPRPKTEEIPVRISDGELSDEELEYVVGGLTRPWVEPLLPWDRPASTR